EVMEKFMAIFKYFGNCGAGYRSCVLGPTGNVRFCLLLPEEYLIIGNLAKNSIEEVFRNSLVECLSNISSPNRELCGECPHLYFCLPCTSRGIYKYEEIGHNCKWAEVNEIDKLVTLPKKDLNKKTRANCPQLPFF
ncbi:MAG: SPASM domain-containing protein, partial [Candidatus Bathyarchaeia archaeon]